MNHAFQKKTQETPLKETKVAESRKRDYLSRRQLNTVIEAMNDLRRYLGHRKQIDSEFEENFDEEYEAFKIGVLLKQARGTSGMTQEEVAKKLHTKKSAISRIENHAEDIRLSTLEKFVAVLGRKLEISIISARKATKRGQLACHGYNHTERDS